MTKQVEIAFGSIILLAVIFGLGMCLVMTKPTAEEIKANRTVDKIVQPQNVLTLEIAEKIKNLKKNGQVPVTVSQDEVGRENPFLPF
jgi:hypothetical protein